MPEIDIIGSILSGSYFGAADAFLRFRLFAGAGWTPLESSGSGQTQTSRADPVTDILTWSHPIEMHYATTTLAGWPRVAVAVWQVDAFGRNEISGYGVTFVPPSPGVHIVDVACWRPQGSTLQELGGEQSRCADEA
jgi:B9 domain-containing protein 2